MGLLGEPTEIHYRISYFRFLSKRSEFCSIPVSIPYLLLWASCIPKPTWLAQIQRTYSSPSCLLLNGPSGQTRSSTPLLEDYFAPLERSWASLHRWRRCTGAGTASTLVCFGTPDSSKYKHSSTRVHISLCVDRSYPQDLLGISCTWFHQPWSECSPPRPNRFSHWVHRIASADRSFSRQACHQVDSLRAGSLTGRLLYLPFCWWARISSGIASPSLHHQHIYHSFNSSHYSFLDLVSLAVPYCAKDLRWWSPRDRFVRPPLFLFGGAW